MFDILEKCPLFGGVNKTELEKYFAGLHFQTKVYDKEQIIAQSGDVLNSLFIVLRGSVRGEMMDFSGHTIKIEDIEAPRPLAVAFIFGKDNHFPVNIIANETTTLLVIPRESVISLMQTNRYFLRNFMNVISSRAQFLSDRLRFLSFQTIKGKLAHYILDLAKEGGGVIELPLSQEKLAELFGVTRPSLGRALRDLHNKKIIDAKGRVVSIMNKEALIELLK